MGYPVRSLRLLIGDSLHNDSPRINPETCTKRLTTQPHDTKIMETAINRPKDQRQQQVVNGTTSSKVKTNNERETNDMAFQLQSSIKRSELPVMRQVSKPSATVRGNGQIGFSSIVTKLFGSATHLVIGWADQKARLLGLQAVSKAPKGMANDDLFKLSVPKKNGGTAFVSASGLLSKVGYDYKASGNQVFDATVYDAEKAITFTLPKGKLTPKPVVPRKKKVAASGAGAGATVTQQNPDEPEPEGEELEEEETT